ncbi:MAG: hypothetical protein WDO70_07350 [Alphaproteobacteria bacterium]
MTTHTQPASLPRTSCLFNKAKRITLHFVTPVVAFISLAENVTDIGDLALKALLGPTQTSQTAAGSDNVARRDASLAPERQASDIYALRLAPDGNLWACPGNLPPSNKGCPGGIKLNGFSVAVLDDGVAGAPLFTRITATENGQIIPLRPLPLAAKPFTLAIH